MGQLRKAWSAKPQFNLPPARGWYQSGCSTATRDRQNPPAGGQYSYYTMPEYGLCRYALVPLCLYYLGLLTLAAAQTANFSRKILALWRISTGKAG